MPSASNFETELHTIQVHQVNLNVDPIECEDGEKLNPEEILSIKKESYTGTAEINSSSLDAGMEVPTLIHNSPEEALNLNQFEAHLRPFLKNIFLEKYPNTVALHSLDAGNISKTLGYTALRLIPGETLPRHKRIYHLSPQDTRYLEELLEHFIKLSCIIFSWSLGVRSDS